MEVNILFIYKEHDPPMASLANGECRRELWQRLNSYRGTISMWTCKSNKFEIAACSSTTASRSPCFAFSQRLLICAYPFLASFSQHKFHICTSCLWQWHFNFRLIRLLHRSTRSICSQLNYIARLMNCAQNSINLRAIISDIVSNWSLFQQITFSCRFIHWVNIISHLLAPSMHAHKSPFDTQRKPRE